ncbi:MAG: hypothetical protein WAR41_03340 [Azonexus sp.]
MRTEMCFATKAVAVSADRTTGMAIGTASRVIAISVDQLGQPWRHGAKDNLMAPPKLDASQPFLPRSALYRRPKNDTTASTTTTSPTM